MKEAPKLICFDLGRVLIRICDGWRHACEIARLPVQMTHLDGAATARLLEFVHASEIGRIDQAEFNQRTAPLLGISPEQVNEISNAYLLGIYPGVVTMIDSLEAAGYKTACLSNTNDNHWRIINDQSSVAHLPLDRLDYAFASHLVRARKPEDTIYAHVERTTGFAGAEIMFFDDVQENIDAALRRGWRAHLVLHDGDPMRQVRAHLKSEIGFSSAALGSRPVRH